MATQATSLNGSGIFQQTLRPSASTYVPRIPIILAQLNQTLALRANLARLNNLTSVTNLRIYLANNSSLLSLKRANVTLQNITNQTANRTIEYKNILTTPDNIPTKVQDNVNISMLDTNFINRDSTEHWVILDLSALGANTTTHVYSGSIIAGFPVSAAKVYPVAGSQSFTDNRRSAAKKNTKQYLYGDATNTIDTSITPIWALRYTTPNSVSGMWSLKLTINGVDYVVDPYATPCATLYSDYNLTGPISVNTSSFTGSQACFEVGAANVAIDCNGFSITGDGLTPGSVAIYSNSSGTVLKNCNISGFSNDVYLDGAAGGMFANNTFSGSTGILFPSTPALPRIPLAAHSSTTHSSTPIRHTVRCILTRAHRATHSTGTTSRAQAATM